MWKLKWRTQKRGCTIWRVKGSQNSDVPFTNRIRIKICVQNRFQSVPIRSTSHSFDRTEKIYLSAGLIDRQAQKELILYKFCREENSLLATRTFWSAIMAHIPTYIPLFILISVVNSGICFESTANWFYSSHSIRIFAVSVQKPGRLFLLLKEMFTFRWIEETMFWLFAQLSLFPYFNQGISLAITAFIISLVALL